MRSRNRRRLGPASAAGVVLAVGAFLFLTAGPSAPGASATRIFVPTKKHATLQAAIDAAAPGDTLWVKRGVYPGPFTLKKRLLLFADAGPESTVLDGGDSVRVLHVEGVKGGGIIGFGIRGGKAVSGGGIYCLRDTSFSVEDCVFTKNWESGLAFWQCDAAKVGNALFKENLGSALQFNRSTGFILSSRFIGNRGNGGGAIYLAQSQLLFPARNLLFQDNRAEETLGGAIMADSSRLTLANCAFRKNSSASSGGAVAAIGRSFVQVSRCEFAENSAAQAGALHGDASQLLVGYSLFRENRATAGGAAVGVLGRFDANVNQVFSNNTFYKNATNGSGGTLFAVKTSPEIRKSIFVVEGKDQLAVAGVESTPLYECNLIHDPSGASLGSLPSRDTLVGDPNFCDPASGNFDLRDLSPAARASCGPVGARPVSCKTFKMAPSK